MLTQDNRAGQSAAALASETDLRLGKAFDAVRRGLQSPMAAAPAETRKSSAPMSPRQRFRKAGLAAVAVGRFSVAKERGGPQLSEATLDLHSSAPPTSLQDDQTAENTDEAAAGMDSMDCSSAMPVLTLSVVCPDGVHAGETLFLTTPDGQELEVVVPDGVGPGDAFELYLPSAEAVSSEADDSAPRTEQELDEAHDDATEKTHTDGKSENLLITCPEGVGSGEFLLVSTTAGQEVEVQIPEGIEPGDDFKVTVDLNINAEAVIQTDAPGKAQLEDINETGAPAPEHEEGEVQQQPAQHESLQTEDSNAAVPTTQNTEHEEPPDQLGEPLVEPPATPNETLRVDVDDADPLAAESAQLETDVPDSLVPIREIEPPTELGTAQQINDVVDTAHQAEFLAVDESAAAESSLSPSDERNIQIDETQVASLSLEECTAIPMEERSDSGNERKLPIGQLPSGPDDIQAEAERKRQMHAEVEAEINADPVFGQLESLLQSGFGSESDDRDSNIEGENVSPVGSETHENVETEDATLASAPQAKSVVDIKSGAQTDELCQLGPVDQNGDVETQAATTTGVEEVDSKVETEKEAEAKRRQQIQAEVDREIDEDPTHGDLKTLQEGIDNANLTGETAEAGEEFSEDEKHENLDVDGKTDRPLENLVDSDDEDFMTVICPDNVTEGQLILVTTPDGREVEADVPEGILPGDEFEVFIGILDAESVTDAPEMDKLEEIPQAPAPPILDVIEHALSPTCQDIVAIDAAIQQAESEQFTHSALSQLKQKRAQLFSDQSQNIPDLEQESHPQADAIEAFDALESLLQASSPADSDDNNHEIDVNMHSDNGDVDDMADDLRPNDAPKAPPGHTETLVISCPEGLGAPCICHVSLFPPENCIAPRICCFVCVFVYFCPQPVW